MKSKLFPRALLNIGMDFAKQTDADFEGRVTMALCLPRVEFASALVCLGFLKEKLDCKTSDNEEEMMDSMVGEWVGYATMAGKTEIGILERSEFDESFRIALFKKKLPDFSKMSLDDLKRYTPPVSAGLWTLLERADWHRVSVVSKEFNPERRVNQRTITKFVNNASSMNNICKLLGIDFPESGSKKDECLVTIAGNKARLTDEFQEDISPDEKSSLAAILRPNCLNDFENGYRCKILGRKSSMAESEGDTVFLEAGRTLGDQLAESRAFHRLVILGRNSCDYDECAAILHQEFSSHSRGQPEVQSEIPSTISRLTFFHA